MPKGVYARKPGALRRPFRPFAVCKVEGCSADATRRGPGMCEMHYYRQRRIGTTRAPAPRRAKRRMHSHGYVLVPSNGHPLAPDSTYIYEHRAVMYADRGDGPFDCHWCGVEITWKTLDVDHVNETKNDNRPGNLVPSCHACNIGRGHHKVVRQLRENGRLVTLRERTMCVSEWARELDISAAALTFRLDAGWPIERALTEPRGKTGPKSRRAA